MSRVRPVPDGHCARHRHLIASEPLSGAWYDAAMPPLSRTSLRALLAFAIVGTGCCSRNGDPGRIRRNDTLVGTTTDLRGGCFPDHLVYVNSDGNLSDFVLVPVVGEVPAAGRTREELATDIERRIKSQDPNAHVVVEVRRAE